MKAIVTGAAGFAGYSLTKELSERGYEVFAVVRPQSSHNDRIYGLPNVHLIELDCADYDLISQSVKDKCDIFFHLAWFGGRYDIDEQNKNIIVLDNAIKSAAALGCKRIVCTGSQAEYGPQTELINEKTTPNPIDAYGAAKISAMHIGRQRAKEVGIEFIWGRIFSLYGLYEPIGRMLPAMLIKLNSGETMQLSSCEQYWDYLDVRDAAKALIAISEKGKDGEIYNIANGECRPLKEFVDIVMNITGNRGQVVFGLKSNPFYSLNVDVSKIIRDTGWKPEIDFEDGIRDYLNILINSLLN